MCLVKIGVPGFPYISVSFNRMLKSQLVVLVGLLRSSHRWWCGGFSAWRPRHPMLPCVMRTLSRGPQCPWVGCKSCNDAFSKFSDVSVWLSKAHRNWHVTSGVFSFIASTWPRQDTNFCESIDRFTGRIGSSLGFEPCKTIRLTLCHLPEAAVWWGMRERVFPMAAQKSSISMESALLALGYPVLNWFMQYSLGAAHCIDSTSVTTILLFEEV